jgi:Asp-tRNA(Asn)/Glu-tRNA(Gln) amidotransferase C subunit
MDFEDNLTFDLKDCLKDGVVEDVKNINIDNDTDKEEITKLKTILSTDEKMEKMEKMEQKITSIIQKVDRLLELLETDCKKMTNHIDFVENVYENVKTPFSFIMNTVNDYTKNLMIRDKNTDKHKNVYTDKNVYADEDIEICDKLIESADAP